MGGWERRGLGAIPNLEGGVGVAAAVGREQFSGTAGGGRRVGALKGLDVTAGHRGVTQGFVTKPCP